MLFETCIWVFILENKKGYFEKCLHSVEVNFFRLKHFSKYLMGFEWQEAEYTMKEFRKLSL